MLRRWAKQFGIIFAVWTAAGFLDGCEILVINTHMGHALPLRDGLLRALRDEWLYAVLTPGVLWFYAKFRFERKRWPASLAANLLGVAAYLLLWSALKVAIYPVDDLLTGVALPRGWHLFRILLIHNVHDALWFYGITVAVIESLRYQRAYRERQTRNARLESQLAHAQLTALKMQLDPHFLFNTLHAVSGLMHENADAAVKTVDQLSALLRMSFESGNEQEVTLRREMEFLSGYLEIQKTRLRDRLNIKLNVAPELLEAMVPNMITQPLVENAVKYGIASRRTSGVIGIHAEVLGGMLCLSISDNGPGLSSQDAGQPGKGVGIANTRARLQQLYGSNHRFSLSSSGGAGTEARLEIPFRLQPATF